MPGDPIEQLSAHDDSQLMDRLRCGDRAALAEIVRRHQRRAVDIAVRTLRDRHLAEDVAQDAFLRVWRSAPEYTPTARFTTWLYRIVVNLCLDENKKRRPRLADPPDEADRRAAAAGQGLEVDDRAIRVRAALDRLPDRQRTAVVLHKYAGLPMRDIADVTGWSESAVESLLVRAYASLRQWLKEFAP